MVTVTALGNSIVEQDTNYNQFNVQVQLDQVSSEVITVPWRILPGTLVDGADRSFWTGSYSSGTLRFNPGTTVQEVRVYPAGDFLAEFDESLTFEILQPTNANLANGMLTQQVAGWVLDDDGTPSPLALWVSDPKVMEGGAGTTTTLTYSLELSRPADQTYAIDWSLGGSATPGSDFTNTSGTVTFLTGQRTAEVAVTVRGDTVIEGNEYIDLVLDLPGGIGETTGGRGTIVDDDAGPGPFVLAEGRSVSEGNTSYRQADFVISLSSPTAQSVTVPWRLQSGTAEVSTDLSFNTGSYVSGTVFFSAGEMQETVRVYVKGETLQEADESIILELLTPTNALLPGGVTVTQTAAWIIDDDSLTDQLSLFVSDPVVKETDSNAVTASFQFELSRPAPRDLSIGFRTVDGSATQGSDYTGKTGTVMILKGQSSATLGVEVLADNAFEASESILLALTLPADIAAATLGEATILNDDLITDVNTVNGNAGNNVLRGTAGPDIVDGKDGNDDIFGEGSGDRLIGGSGADEIRSGEGADYAYGGDGTDSIWGDLGGDRLFGGAQDDAMYGGDNRDAMRGGTGNDRIFGGGGGDTIYGDAGNEVIRGGNGNDSAYGGAGSDRMFGDGGNDKMYGGLGNDFIVGGTGVDRIDPGKGTDTVGGGGGADQFVFGAYYGVNTVLDYNDSADLIRIVSGANNFRDLRIIQKGADAVISFTGTQIVLEDTDASVLRGNDFLF